MSFMEYPMKPNSTPKTNRTSQVAAPHARASTKSLPQYLHRRGDSFYFKRKIPTDAATAFPNSQGQVWKSLRTDLFAKATVLLAVEVSEFDLAVALVRRQAARERTAVHGTVMPQASVSSTREQTSTTSLQASQTEFGEVLHRRAGQVKARTAKSKAISAVALAQQAPVPPTRVASAAIRPTLRHLFEFWKIHQTRHRTIQSVETAVTEFHALVGALAAEDVTRQHVRAYRDSLIERSLSDSTILNRIGFLATLFRSGQVELIEHVLGNPFERIPVNGGKSLRVGKDRRAYTMSELNHIFSSRLYTTTYRPRGQVAEAAFWAPLMGPFVGGRIEEIAQLRIEDIQCVNGAWCIRICNVGEDQSIKNLGSYRRVPLHQMLVRCGFLRYVAQQAAAGQDRLFPSLSNDNGNRVWSNALGKWYSRYLDSLGLSDPRLDYHSFRYSFRQQCTLSGVENEQRDALTGHWVTNRDAGRTYMRAEERQYPFPKLVSAIGQLRYDELKLGHLFVQVPMEGVDRFVAQGIPR